MFFGGSKGSESVGPVVADPCSAKKLQKTGLEQKRTINQNCFGPCLRVSLLKEHRNRFLFLSDQLRKEDCSVIVLRIGKAHDEVANVPSSTKTLHQTCPQYCWEFHDQL